MIDVLDVEGVVQQGQQEVLLTLVEVVVGFERLQTVDEFLVGVFFGFEVVEVLVIVQDDQVDLFCEVVVNAGYFLQKVHDDLDVLDFFARLDFSIVGETIVEEEDGLGVFGHHDDAYFILDELEVEFGSLQVLEVVLVPGQGQQRGDEFELEQEVDAGLVATIDQLYDGILDAVVQVDAGALQEVQVHVERELQRRNVRLLLASALPVDQTMAQVDEVYHFELGRHFSLLSEGMQQRYQKLRLKQIVFLIDAIDKPSVIEDVEQQVAVLHPLVGLATDPHDVPAAARVEHEASVLQLHVVTHFQEVDGQCVLEFVGNLVASAIGHLQQEHVVLQVLFFIRHFRQQQVPLFDDMVPSVVGLLLRHQRCQTAAALQSHVALRYVLQDHQYLLDQHVHQFVIELRQVAQQTAKPIELSSSHSCFELATPVDQVQKFRVAFGSVSVAAGQRRVHGFLLAHERGVGYEGGDQFGDQFIVSVVSAFARVDSEAPKNVPEYFAAIAQQVFVWLLNAALEEAGKDCDDTLIDVKVDVLVLSGQLENRQQQLGEVSCALISVGVVLSVSLPLIYGEDGIRDLLNRRTSTFQHVSMSLMRYRKGSTRISLTAKAFTYESISVRLLLIYQSVASQMGLQQGKLEARTALLTMYLRLRDPLPSSRLLRMGYSLMRLVKGYLYSLTILRYLSS